MEQTKTCGVCGATLPISQFYKNSATADGIDYRCKACNLVQRKKTKTANRKAFNISELSDEALCGELRKRGFVGELLYKKDNYDINMVHYYVMPATREAVEYLRNGGREFYTHKEGPDKHLTVRFLATPEYVEKMRNRPFLQNIEITKKA